MILKTRKDILLLPLNPLHNSHDCVFHFIISYSLFQTFALLSDAAMANATGSVPDRGPSLMILMWVLTIIASITVVLRFIFRAQKSIIGYDDIFMLVSMVRPLLYNRE